MADVTIVSPVEAQRNQVALNSGPIWTSDLIGYFFYTRTGGEQIFFKKTLDGGETFGSEVTVTSMNGIGFGLWYDRWTSGDNGTLIHIADMDGAGQTAYRALDTSDDTLTTFVSVVDLAHASDIGSAWIIKHVGITKARGGNLYISTAGSNVLVPFDEAFMRSTDGGATWTQRAALLETTAQSLLDFAILMPGNEADNQDIWVAYLDRSATELSLKVYDDSANSFSETSIATGMILSTSGQLLHLGATTRHSDDHMLVAAMSEIGVATGDMRMWDINGSGSIVEKANVLTNESHWGAHISINQQNDDIRVGYFGDGVETFATGKVYFKLSTDGGTSWGAETLFNESAVALVRTMHGDISIGNGGGRYELAWFVPGGGDLMLTNFVNSIAFAGGASPVAISAQVGMQQRNLLLL